MNLKSVSFWLLSSTARRGWTGLSNHSPFTLPVLLDLRWVSSRQHIKGLCYFYLLANLCLFIAVYRSFILKVNIYMLMLKSALLLLLFYLVPLIFIPLLLFLPSLGYLNKVFQIPFWFIYSVNIFLCVNFTGCCRYYIYMTYQSLLISTFYYFVSSAKVHFYLDLSTLSSQISLTQVSDGVDISFQSSNMIDDL